MDKTQQRRSGEDGPAGNPRKRKPETSPTTTAQPKQKRANNGSLQSSRPLSKSKAAQRDSRPDSKSTKNARARSRVKQYAARTIAAQTSASAFANGELNTSSFVNARAFEIDALDAALRRSRAAGSTRAFQAVPRDLRRRGASHDVRRVPKRLRNRAKREMNEDNTPSRKSLRADREKSVKGRAEKGKRMLRRDVARRLKKLSSDMRRAGRSKNTAPRNQSETNASTEVEKQAGVDDRSEIHVDAKSAAKSTNKKKKVQQKASLAKPPLPPSKFRKRQIHKSWLPTHLFHAKRAHLTPPKQPLWRFAIPLSPTEKSYRASHRASMNAGAIAWDMSYMATIKLEGPEASCLGLLRSLSVSIVDGRGTDSKRWLEGSRVWSGWAFEREGAKLPIAPIDIIWSAKSAISEEPSKGKKKEDRTLMIRVHPSAFRQLWEETVRLSKVQRPALKVEDLRFELGSIEITGPGACEVFAGVLQPISTQTDPSPGAKDSKCTVEDLWKLMRGVTNPSALPRGALFAMNVSDPRLRQPLQTLKPLSAQEQSELVRFLVAWPLDQTSKETHPAHESHCGIFERAKRQAASRSLPSQKAINRRKALTAPGRYPDPAPADPKIPILAYLRHSHHPRSDKRTGRDVRHDMGAMTLIAPWKCIRPLWYCLMFYNISTGGTARFGGLNEKRQIAFTASTPWFPADFPATPAGKVWEAQEREVRKEAWERKPKGRRVEWDSLDLGQDHKGEIGVGWACDWEFLVRTGESGTEASKEADAQGDSDIDVTQLTLNQACKRLYSKTHPTVSTSMYKPEIRRPFELATISLQMATRGYPTVCARIYRLPLQNHELREKWLSLSRQGQSPSGTNKQGCRRLIDKRAADPDHVSRARLAQGLLAPRPVEGEGVIPKPGQANYPVVPDASDLIGFVTTGNFNLGEGKPTAVGSILLERVLEYRAKHGSKVEERICILREAGQNIGRLARWELV